MKKVISILLSLCMLIAGSSFVVFAGDSEVDRSSEFKTGCDYYKLTPGVDYEEHTVIVCFTDDVSSRDEIIKIAIEYSFCAKDVDYQDYVKYGCFIIPEGMNVTDAILLLEKDSRVKFAAPNMYVYKEDPDSSSDPESEVTPDRSSEFKLGIDFYKYDDYVKGEVIVQFKNSIQYGDISAVANDNNCVLEKRNILCFYQDMKLALFKLPEGQTVPEGIKQLEKDPRVDTCSPNYYVYQESFEDSFSRTYGVTRYDTAIEVAKRIKTVKSIDKFENIVVACGEDYPDALSGGYLASVKNAPILLVSSSTEAKVERFIKDNLATGGTVYILGGEAVVSKNFEKKFSKVKRLWGKDRYLTNMAVLKEAGFPKDYQNNVLVCTGNGYADSLAASATSMPVFLVGDALTSEQKKFIKDYHIRTFHILGGEGAVAESTANEMQDTVYPPGTIHQTDILTYRYAGSDRIATSVEVANLYRGKNFAPLKKNVPDSVVLVYANNYADGLTGGAFAEALGAPIILIDDNADSISKVKAYLTEKGINKIYVLGGASLISNNTVKSLQ